MLKDINLDDILIHMEDLHLQYDENTINRSFNNKINLEFISNEAKNQFEKLSKFLEFKTIILEEV